jgi:hypothetical protein
LQHTPAGLFPLIDRIKLFVLLIVTGFLLQLAVYQQERGIIVTLLRHWKIQARTIEAKYTFSLVERVT